MTFSSFRLMQYHQKLDSELRAERARRWPDVFRIQKLKRLKLAVKDRLASVCASRKSEATPETVPEGGLSLADVERAQKGQSPFGDSP
jgi:hypothetical protein